MIEDVNAVFFGRKKRKKREDDQAKRMAESQHALLTAATETANAANAVTSLLKARLDDALKQFESTARILNDALFVCEEDGTIRASNPAARHMFAEPSLIDRSILDLFDHGGERIETAADLWDMLRTTSSWLPTEKTPLRGRQSGTGALFWIEPICTALNWSDGSLSVLLIIRNTSPVVALQKSADMARGTFRTLFDASFDGLLIERDDRIVAANASVGDLFGYPSSELLNRPISILFVPEEHARVEANLDRCNFTTHGLHANGSLRSVIFTATQIIWKGETARLITLKDLTDVQELEEAAAMKRDNGIDMIVCFDPEYRITFANRSFALEHGSKREDLVGRDVRDFIGCQGRAEFEASVASLCITYPSSRTQARCSDASPTPIIQDWIDHAIFDGAGNPIEFQRVGRDISLIMNGFTPR